MTRSTGRTQRARRYAAASAGIVAVIASSLLAGCSAGQIAETSKIVAAVPGGSTTIPVPVADNPDSSVKIQNALIAYAGPAGYQAGETAPLELRIINQTIHSITVTLPATGVTLQGTNGVDGTTPIGTPIFTGPAAVAAQASASPAAAPSATPSGTPSPGASPSGPPVPSPSATGSAAPAAPASVDGIRVAPGGIAILVPGGNLYAAITKLTQQIAPGNVVNVSFNVTDEVTKLQYPAIVGVTFAPSTATASRVPSS